MHPNLSFLHKKIRALLASEKLRIYVCLTLLFLLNLLHIKYSMCAKNRLEIRRFMKDFFRLYFLHIQCKIYENNLKNTCFYELRKGFFYV
jgi:hypothetical protein